MYAGEYVKMGIIYYTILYCLYYVSIAGAVLEDEADSFRFLAASEMDWPASFNTSVCEDSTGADTDSASSTVPVPVFESATYAEALVVSAWVSPLDIEEIRVGVAKEGLGKYVALRASDEKLFVCQAKAGCRVPVTIAKVCYLRPRHIQY